MCAGLSIAAQTAEAVPGSVVSKLEAGNRLYSNGNYQQALDAYALLETDLPDNPELAYNEGLALYRQRDFTRAAEKFNEAILNTRELSLEARAKFNLGNVAYSQALEKMSDLQEAIDHARDAIRFYRDSLELNPDDRDARTNIEIAQLFIKDLVDKQKQQEEQQQNQDQQQQRDNPQQQDSGENQQKQDQEGQNQQSQDQEDSQQDQQQQQDESQENEEQEKQASNESNESDEQQQQAASQDPSADQQEQDEQQQALAREVRELSPQDAERMLQAVRDKEAKRREELAKRMRGNRRAVQRDW